MSARTTVMTLLRVTVAVALSLLLPTIAAAGDPQATAAVAGTLDFATRAALGIDDSPPAVALQAGRPVKPDTGTWSWTPGAYAYDPSGNIAAIGTTQTFVYDRHGRLVDAVVSRTGGTEHRAYTYDRFGNRTGSSAAGTATPTSLSTNHLTSLSAVYDDAGNLTQLQPPNQVALYQYKYDRLGAIQEVKATNVAGTPTQLHIYTAGDDGSGRSTCPRIPRTGRSATWAEKCCATTRSPVTPGAWPATTFTGTASSWRR